MFVWWSIVPEICPLRNQNFTSINTDGLEYFYSIPLRRNIAWKSRIRYYESQLSILSDGIHTLWSKTNFGTVNSGE